MTYDTGREQALLSLLRNSGEKGLSLSEISAHLTPDGKGKSTIFRLLAALVERGTVRKFDVVPGSEIDLNGTKYRISAIERSCKSILILLSGSKPGSTRAA